jgi:hypothetical protein
LFFAGCDAKPASAFAATRAKERAGAGANASPGPAHLGAARLVGARTQGEMLSQSPFDLAEGYMIALPVADYFSARNGRIEGAGVMPGVLMDPAMALDYAKARAAAPE